MPVSLVDEAIKEGKEKIAGGKTDSTDKKSRAGIMKAVIGDLAKGAGIELT
jgi:hypothetical protein